MIFARRALLKTIDAEKVKQAIQAAERQTSGQIRVSVAPFFWGDVRKVAERAFDRLGMTRTAHRNGVLFFIVPSRKRFVVLGDEGIHTHVGDEFWADVVAAVSEDFRKGDFTDGLVKGIATVGRELATRFPYDPSTDRNELPDDVDFN
jgi:uncharacterized membrane protein